MLSVLTTSAACERAAAALERSLQRGCARRSCPVDAFDLPARVAAFVRAVRGLKDAAAGLA